MSRDSDCYYCPSCGNWRFVKSGRTYWEDETVGERQINVMHTKCLCTACKHRWTETEPNVKAMREHLQKVKTNEAVKQEANRKKYRGERFGSLTDADYIARLETGLNLAREVEATGVTDEVYTTPTGMNIADPEERMEGWKQKTPTTRVRVKSTDIGTHQRWWVWQEVREEQT